MNSPGEKIKAFVYGVQQIPFEQLEPQELYKLCRLVIEVADALEKYKLSEENQNRLDQVDAQTLRRIILHGNHIANDTLTRLAEGLK